MNPLIKGCCLLAATYIVDVPVRRHFTAKAARKYADKKGKPLLNIGAGTDKTALFGSTLYGDVNCDLNGCKNTPHGTPGQITYADAQDLKDFKDGQFSAVLASHILEHLPDPQRAIKEWLRVTDGHYESLFVITPSWWAPHTWCHPGHLWYATDNAGGTKGGKLVRIRKEYNPSIKKITTLRGINHIF